MSGRANEVAEHSCEAAASIELHELPELPSHDGEAPKCPLTGDSGFKLPTLDKFIGST